MGKKTIGIDIDGVLADSVSRWLQEAEARFGIKAIKKDIVRYSIEENLHFKAIRKEDVPELFKLVWSKYETVNIENPDIPSILDSISEKFNIYVTTSNVNEQIGPWLRKNRIRHDKLIQLPADIGKYQIQDVDIFIDDYPEVIENVAKVGKTGIILRQPWNDEFIRNNKNPKIFVAYNWREIEQILLTQII